MGIRESKTAACDRCPATTSWETQWVRATENSTRATHAPAGWAWCTVNPEPDGSAKWRALLCPACTEALDDFVNALKP